MLAELLHLVGPGPAHQVRVPSELYLGLRSLHAATLRPQDCSFLQENTFDLNYDTLG